MQIATSNWIHGIFLARRQRVESDAIACYDLELGKILLWMVAKSCTTLDGWNPIEEWDKPPSTGAGFRDHPQ